jgi:hypothetical protein
MRIFCVKAEAKKVHQLHLPMFLNPEADLKGTDNDIRTTPQLGPPLLLLSVSNTAKFGTMVYLKRRRNEIPRQM